MGGFVEDAGGFGIANDNHVVPLIACASGIVAISADLVPDLALRAYGARCILPLVVWLSPLPFPRRVARVFPSCW